VATTAAKCPLTADRDTLAPRAEELLASWRSGFVTSAFKGGPAVQTMRSVLSPFTRFRHSAIGWLSV